MSSVERRLSNKVGQWEPWSRIWSRSVTRRLGPRVSGRVRYTQSSARCMRRRLWDESPQQGKQQSQHGIKGTHWEILLRTVTTCCRVGLERTRFRWTGVSPSQNCPPTKRRPGIRRPAPATTNPHSTRQGTWAGWRAGGTWKELLSRQAVSPARERCGRIWRHFPASVPL